VDLAEVRRAWPEVLERLRELRKTPWTFIKDNTEPIEVGVDVLTLGVRSSRLRDTLAERDDYVGYLQQALLDTLGQLWRIEAVAHPSAGPGSGAAVASDPAAARAPAARAAAGRPGADRPRPVAAPTPQGEELDTVAPDDQVLDEVSGADLLSRELGATVIDVVDES
jgi:DNA polymerase-3 subunit gamma/tau